MDISEIKKYSIDNDYMWNTAVYFDFWKLKSTLYGIGTLRNRMK